MHQVILHFFKSEKEKQLVKNIHHTMYQDVFYNYKELIVSNRFELSLNRGLIKNRYFVLNNKDENKIGHIIKGITFTKAYFYNITLDELSQEDKINLMSHSSTNVQNIEFLVL